MLVLAQWKQIGSDWLPAQEKKQSAVQRSGFVKTDSVMQLSAEVSFNNRGGDEFAPVEKPLSHHEVHLHEVDEKTLPSKRVEFC